MTYKLDGFELLRNTGMLHLDHTKPVVKNDMIQLTMSSL